MVQPPAAPELVLDRYHIYDQLAAGGMAVVHLGRLVGPAGFTRTVAIKRLHAAFAGDPEFSAMFLDEARLASRVRHPNVVQTLDVISLENELLLVMDYVHGEALSYLLKLARDRGAAIPIPVVVSILAGVLQGLQAAHEARDDRGELLEMVHRDVSPQNILVGVDGVARVLDFGVAKAAGRIQSTHDGQLKGKLSYMAPEQLGGQVSRRTDVFAASAVAWEAMTGRKLFAADDEAAIVGKLLSEPIPAPSELREGVPPALDAVLLRGLARQPEMRFATAKDMALALTRAVTPADAAEVGEWVEGLARESLAKKASLVHGMESTSPNDHAPTRSEAAADRTPASEGPSAARPPSGTRWMRRLLSPSALLLGGCLVIASAVLVRRGHVPSPAAPAAAGTGTAPADPARVRVLVLSIENQTGDPVFDDTVAFVLGHALTRSAVIEPYAPGHKATLQGLAAELDAGQYQPGEELARALLARDGGRVVTVRGAVSRKGAGYTLSVNATDTRTGTMVFSGLADASDLRSVVPTIGSLACDLRAALGDEPPTDTNEQQQTGLSLSIEADHDALVAIALINPGRYDEALFYLRRASAADPSWGKVHWILANLLGDMGDSAGSRREYELALQNAGGLSDIDRLQVQAEYYDAIGEHDRAAASLLEARRLAPEDFHVETSLADELLKTHHVARAVEVTRQTTKEHPGEVIAWTNLAQAELCASHPDAAAAAAQKAISEFSTPLPHDYVYLALAAALRGNGRDARDAYEKLATRDESLAAYGLADLAMAEGRLDDADKLLRDGIEADVRATRTQAASWKQALLAEELTRRGDRARALAAALEGARSTDVSVLYAVAEVEIALGDLKDALSTAAPLADRVAESDRMVGKVIEAEALRKRGRTKEALAMLAQAAQISDAWIVHLASARAHLDAGDVAGAEGELATCEARSGEATLAFGPDAPSYRLVASLATLRAPPSKE